MLAQARESNTGKFKKINKYIWGEGERRVLTGIPSYLYKIFSLIAAFYIFWAIIFYPQPIMHRAICFGLFFTITFIVYTMPGTDTKYKVPWYDWLLVVLSLLVSGYISLNLDRLITRFAFVDQVSFLDIVFGILTIILLLEGTRRIIGPWISILSILSLSYLYFGSFLFGRFGHNGFTLNHVIDEMFLTTDGIWGWTLGVASNQLILFIIFGAFLLCTGAGAFLFDFAAAIAGKQRGGLAKISVLGSGFFGMISGSSVANAATIGVITIPMMKKSGYPADFAASVETCASAGGIIMPPVMGSVAFIMAEVIGIPYGQVALAALLPAILYFLAIYFTVDIRARKMGLQGMNKQDIPPFFQTVKKGLPFFIPIFFLIFRLSFSGVSIARIGLESIVLIILVSFFNRENKMTIKVFIDALINGISNGLMVVTTMAACGIMIGVFNLTGIGAKFSSALMALSNQSLLGTLFLVMLLAMIMGLAINISTSYLLVAVVAAPALIKLGIPVMAAHMFILFYAAMATITPPVALTAFAAASIAGAPPMRVGFMAMKMALIAYVLPFIFVYWPALLLHAPLIQIVLAFILGVFSVALIAMGIEGWWFDKNIPSFARILIVGAGIILLTGNVYLIAISITVLFAINHFLSIPRSN